MSAAMEPAMTFEPAFWHQHWRHRAPSGTTSESQVNPYVLNEARARPDLADSAASALEVGCGAGSEALALAQNGWTVTAVDISADALRIGAERAAVQGLGERTTWVEADIISWSPGSQFQLVTCAYVHTLLTQPELLRRLTDWVAPGGTLLMVGHAPGHHSHGDHGHPPQNATNELELLANTLNSREWVISTTKTSRTVPSGRGPEKTLYDVVLRAERQ